MLGLRVWWIGHHCVNFSRRAKLAVNRNHQATRANTRKTGRVWIGRDNVATCFKNLDGLFKLLAGETHAAIIMQL
jgi:hypothetical protein